MKLQCFSVLDQVAMAFLPPFFGRSKGEAIRSFTDAILDQNHMFSKHRSDFVLFWIGEFDDASGKFEAVEPQRVLSGTEAVNTSEWTP